MCIICDIKQNEDSNTLYSVASIMTNLSNAYDVTKPNQEMIELAKYAKYHIPEDHEKVSIFCTKPLKGSEVILS